MQRIQSSPPQRTQRIPMQCQATGTQFQSTPRNGATAAPRRALSAQPRLDQRARDGATMSDVSSVCNLLASIHAPGDEGDVRNPDHARSWHVSIHARVTGAILPDYRIELDWEMRSGQRSSAVHRASLGAPAFVTSESPACLHAGTQHPPLVLDATSTPLI